MKIELLFQIDRHVYNIVNMTRKIPYTSTVDNMMNELKYLKHSLQTIE